MSNPCDLQTVKEPVTVKAWLFPGAGKFKEELLTALGVVGVKLEACSIATDVSPGTGDLQQVINHVGVCGSLGNSRVGEGDQIRVERAEAMQQQLPRHNQQQQQRPQHLP